MLNAAEWHETEDGWEESLQVSCLSPALLGLLLLPKLLSGAAGPTQKTSTKGQTKPRLHFVSSSACIEFDSSILKEALSDNEPGTTLEPLNAKDGFDGR